MKQSYLIILLFLFSQFSGCRNKPDKPEHSAPRFRIKSLSTNPSKPIQLKGLLKPGFNNFVIDRVPIDIIVPNGKVKGTILVLPGWDFSRDQWCLNTTLCQKAEEKGYCLVMPEMGLSVYSWNYYPETRPDWSMAPTGGWVIKNMLPRLHKKFGLFEHGCRNFLLGLSTGGRGVAIIALRTGTLFKAGSALSGDFDQTLDHDDAVITGFYGSYYEFQERWESVDNPSNAAEFLQTPLFLAHGIADQIVPVQQTEEFYRTLREFNPELPVRIDTVAGMGHDFIFWESELNNSFSFFEEYK